MEHAIQSVQKRFPSLPTVFLISDVLQCYRQLPERIQHVNVCVNMWQFRRAVVILYFLVVCAGSSAQPTENCPHFVEEGSTLDCECQAPSDANQPILSWPGHSDTAHLVKTNIRRSHNGTQFTCLMQVGGHNSTLVYTLQVAYGPSNATMKISGPSPFPTDGSQTMSLYCLAEEVNPAPTYSWFGKCQGTTGSTCTFRPQPPDDDGVEATCRALNSVPLHPISATATSRVNLTYPPTSSPVVSGFTPREVLRTGDNLTCTVTGGKPLVSEVIFRCTGPTMEDQHDVIEQSNVSSTVTVDSSKATGGDTLCICTAVWERGKYNVTYNMNDSATVQIGCSPRPASRLQPGSEDNPAKLTTDGLAFTLTSYPVPDTFLYTFYGNQQDATGEVVSSDMFSMQVTQVGASSFVDCELKPREIPAERLGLYTLTMSNEIGSLSYYFIVNQQVVPDEGSSVADIVGGVFGSIAFVGVVAVVIYCVKKQRDRKYEKPLRRRDQDEAPYTDLHLPASNDNTRELSVHYINTDTGPGQLSGPEEPSSYINITKTQNIYERVEHARENHAYSGLHSS